MRRRKRLLLKPPAPPPGMMYLAGGNLTPIEKVEWAAKVRFIGFSKQSGQHWSKDESYNWNRKSNEQS